MNISNEKFLLSVFCALFFVSGMFLFWQNARELDPDNGKDWWTLSFADPKNPHSLIFTITNHTQQDTFSYEASSAIAPDKEVLSRDSVTIRSGETKTIEPNMTLQVGARTTVSVTLGKEKKEIYR